MMKVGIMAVEDSSPGTEVPNRTTLRRSKSMKVIDAFGQVHEGVIINKEDVPGSEGFWIVMWRVGKRLMSWHAPVDSTDVKAQDDGSFELHHGRTKLTISLAAAEPAA